MRFITDHYRLNQKLVRNTYPSPRIGDNMQQLEGFHYATTLYINTGYFNIRLLSASQYMMKVVTEFGKFRYNHLPMGMWPLRDILQAKMDELLSNIKGVKVYIYYIIFLEKH